MNNLTLHNTLPVLTAGIFELSNLMKAINVFLPYTEYQSPIRDYDKAFYIIIKYLGYFSRRFGRHIESAFPKDV